MADSNNIEPKFQKWLKGEISDEEFSDEVGQEDFLKYQQILTEVDSWTPGDEGIVPDYNEIISTKKQAKVRSLYSKQLFLIAASVSLVLSATILFFLIGSDETKIYTNAGEVKEMLLPDGKSKAFLAGGSTLKWNDKEWSQGIRNINLEGKAYFEVNSGSKFKVSLEAGEVQVLGTRFEIDEFFGFLSVTCFEGRVEASKAGDKIEVRANESYTFYNDGWEEKSVLNQTSPSWLQSTFSFKDSPLLQVFKTLESAYEITVHYSEVNIDRKFSGSFPKDDLKISLKIIFDPLDINYRLEGDDLYLED